VFIIFSTCLEIFKLCCHFLFRVWCTDHLISKAYFTLLIKKRYELYFGCKLVTNIKVGTSYLLCNVCKAYHRIGYGSRQMPFAILVVWRKAKAHSSSCYFCLINTSGITSKSKHTIKYPDMPSAMRPVPDSEQLPLPKPPEI
jgi:hypothetical protein